MRSILSVLEFLIRAESEVPESRYVDFRLLVYYTEKHLYDYKSQRFNKYNLQSYLVLSVKKNLDGVFSMDYDFVKVLHPCKSVACLGSWILNIYISQAFTNKITNKSFGGTFSICQIMILIDSSSRVVSRSPDNFPNVSLRTILRSAAVQQNKLYQRGALCIVSTAPEIEKHCSASVFIWINTSGSNLWAPCSGHNCSISLWYQIHGTWS